MVGPAMRRLLRCGALAVVAVVCCVLVPTGGYAAGPDTLVVSVTDLPAPLTVRAAERPEPFAALFAEVNWLASRPGEAPEPEPGRLGPAYAVTVLAGGRATHQYELYPLATGGPRVFRPARQPDRHRTTAGWFYGRLSMPDSLRAVGVPLAGAEAAGPVGGIGGGELVPDEFDPNSDLTTLLGEWRQFLLLNGAVVVVIALGLAVLSLFVRARYDRRLRRRSP